MNKFSEVSGWGLTPKCRTQLSQLDDLENSTFTYDLSEFQIFRGLGRSYGDAAQISGGKTLSTKLLNKFVFNFDTGQLVAQSGVSISTLIKELAPKGWFVPVTPGTRFVTLGGAIASDIHGKNHHVAGSMSNHVNEITLLTPSGVVTCSKSNNSDLFHATCGGMGLTGLILQISLDLIKIDSTKMVVDTYLSDNLEDSMSRLLDLDKTSTYTVAWIDTLSKGKNLGRGIISGGEHATKEKMKNPENRFAYNDAQKIVFPTSNKINLINKYSAKLFNEFWYRKNKKIQLEKIESFNSFFHPLDGVKNWNFVYGRKGFIQYQFVVPDSESDYVKFVIETLSKKQVPVFLAVLKRFGPENDCFLSFPKAGWTLAVDIPADFPDLGIILDDLDKKLVEANGRIYLTKDSRLKPEMIQHMYPKLELFRKVKSKFDPNNVIKSDLSLRLHL